MGRGKTFMRADMVEGTENKWESWPLKLRFRNDLRQITLL